MNAYCIKCKKVSQYNETYGQTGQCVNGKPHEATQLISYTSHCCLTKFTYCVKCTPQSYNKLLKDTQTLQYEILNQLKVLNEQFQKITNQK